MKLLARKLIIISNYTISIGCSQYFIHEKQKNGVVVCGVCTSFWCHLHVISVFRCHLHVISGAAINHARRAPQDGPKTCPRGPSALCDVVLRTETHIIHLIDTDRDVGKSTRAQPCKCELNKRPIS